MKFVLSTAQLFYGSDICDFQPIRLPTEIENIFDIDITTLCEEINEQSGNTISVEDVRERLKIEQRKIEIFNHEVIVFHGNGFNLTWKRNLE